VPKADNLGHSRPVTGRLYLFVLICKKKEATSFLTNVRGLLPHTQVKDTDTDVSVLAFTVGKFP
jgi:hypothetical protein